MKKIGIIICGRYQSCGGGKCFRALRERAGAFAAYPKDEPVEIVGYSTCGGCPGGNVEYLPEEMIKNGAQVIHPATGLVVGYPPCPRILIHSHGRFLCRNPPSPPMTAGHLEIGRAIEYTGHLQATCKKTPSPCQSRLPEAAETRRPMTPPMSIRRTSGPA